MNRNPSENLRRGRRRIEEIPEISLLKDWTWDTITKCFYLHISINLNHDSPNIPQVTEWYVTAAAIYPFGSLSIYPSCKNGIANTFPHQSINAFEEKTICGVKGNSVLTLLIKLWASVFLKKSRSQLMNGSFGICKELFYGFVPMQKVH